MNIRALTYTALIALLTGTAPAWARIVVDADAPEQAAEANIHVPGPDEVATVKKEEDTIAFLNKDQLHGTLLSIDAENWIHWQSPEALAPIQFKTGQVSDIKLDSHKTAHPAATGQRIGLTNGDEFPGNIVSLDDKTLVLDTWYAGRLSIPRAMLRRITPLVDTNSILYEGPTGLDGWVLGRVGVGQSWSFQDGALIGTNYGTIGRDVKLPDLSEIDFDVVLRGNSQFAVCIYSDRPDNIGNCYLLQLSTGFIAMQRYSRTAGSNDLGSSQIQNLMRHDKSHIELRTNKEKKSIWLLIDGKLVKEWDDPAEFNGGGGNIIFSCQPGTYVKISNIKVTKWDGKFEDSGSGTTNGGEDSIQLANEDKVSGRLETIQDGKVKLSSAYAELNIPMERIGQLDMAPAHSEQAKPDPSDVRAYFPEGGSITMQLTQWDAKGCIGSSPNFGKATFSPDAFARIMFNLPAQQQNEGADDSGGEVDGVDAVDHE